LGCLAVTIPAEHLRRLDEASKIDLVFPHDFLASFLLFDNAEYLKFLNVPVEH
jgi:hypothetical protein